MGILDILAIPIGYVIRGLYALTGNYLITIFLLVLIVRLLLLPSAYKQRIFSITQQKLQPKIRAINKEYGLTLSDDDVIEQNRRIKQLYKDENVSPRTHFLLTFLQFPIFMAVFRVMTRPLSFLTRAPAELVDAILEKAKTIIGEPVSQLQCVNILKEHFATFHDIPLFSEYFADTSALPHLTLFNGAIDLTQKPSLANPDILLIFPVLVYLVSLISALISRRINMTTAGKKETDTKTKLITVGVTLAAPLLVTYFAFRVPPLVCVYYMSSSVVSIITTAILQKLLPMPPQPKEETDVPDAETEKTADTESDT